MVFDQSANDKTVVDAVAIGCDYVGKGEQAVAMVALPEDEQIVVYDTVAPYLVGKDEGHLVDAVGEKAVEESPRQLAGEYGIVYGGIAIGVHMEYMRDKAVLSQAAYQLLGEERIAIYGGAGKGVGQLTRTDVGEGGVENIFDDSEMVVEQGVAVGQHSVNPQRIGTCKEVGGVVDAPWELVLDYCIVACEGIVGQKGQMVVAQGVALEGVDEKRVDAWLWESEGIPTIRQLGTTDTAGGGVAHHTPTLWTSKENRVGR